MPCPSCQRLSGQKVCQCQALPVYHQYPIPEMGLLGEKLNPSRLETWEMQGRAQGSGVGS